jgi:hypothetical protein
MLVLHFVFQCTCTNIPLSFYQDWTTYMNTSSFRIPACEHHHSSVKMKHVKVLHFIIGVNDEALFTTPWAK